MNRHEHTHETNNQDQKLIKVLEGASVSSPQGFHSGGVKCGLKQNQLDLGWVCSDVPATAAGVYTTNLFQAAPIAVTKESVAVKQQLQGVICNSANANACTGERGLQDAYHMRKSFAEKLGIENHLVAVFSTGVIGEFLPMDKINTGIDSIDLSQGDEPNDDFSEAILTTDTYIKNAGVQFAIDGQLVTIGGTSKGSGMIKPNMATMLGCVTTDAAVDPQDLKQALVDVINKTFNMITVDGDTSTNDMVLFLANGLAQNETLNKQHPEWSLFVQGLEMVCQDLAKQVARDGEGATCLIETKVSGALDEKSAQVIAKTIIGSSLVKTAVYGSDANWGRILCAVGYSGITIDPNKVTVYIGPIKMVENGLPVAFDEDKARDVLNQEVVHIDVHLNQGESQAVAWGCDLTYDYVRINASYRS